MKSQTTKPGAALSPTANSKANEKSASKLPIAERGQGKQVRKRPAAAAAESAAALKRPAAALKRPASELSLAAEPASLKRPSAAESSEPAAELAAKPAKRPAAADTELDDLDEEGGESEEPDVDEEGESEDHYADADKDPEAAGPSPGSDAPDSEPDSFVKQKQSWVARKAEQLHHECGRTKAQAQKEANDNWLFSKERRLLLDSMTRHERSRRRLKHPEEYTK